MKKTTVDTHYFYNITVPFGATFKKISNYTLAKRFAFNIETRLGYRFTKNNNGRFNPVFIGSVNIGFKIYLHNEVVK